MKRMVKQLITLGVTLATLFTGASVFAASFDLDPGGSGTGFASVNYCEPGAANQRDSYAVNIPNRGDSQDFCVYVDFRNSSSGYITTPRAHLTFPSQGNSSSVSLTASLSGGHASTATDGVRVTGLPSSWKMEFVPYSSQYSYNSKVQIPVHHLSNHQTCEQYYGIDFSYDNHQFTNPRSVSIPTDAHSSLDGLDYQYMEGWCQQGYVIYRLRVTNTTQTTPVSHVEVDTLSPSSVGTNHAEFNGKVIEGTDVNTWFVYSTTGYPSCSQTTNRVSVSGNYDAGQTFSRYVSGLQPGTTYYYRACASVYTNNGQVEEAEGDVVEFTTTPISRVEVKTLEPDSVSTDHATFMGAVIEGQNLSTWFVYNTTGDPFCSQTTNRFPVGGRYSTGDTFSKVVGGLQPGTTYYYRACASDGQNEAMGDIVSFQTRQISVYHWEIVGDWGPCINGRQTREVRCVDQNGYEDQSQVNCDILTKPDVERACSSQEIPEAETLDEEDVTTDAATLNGRVRMNAVDDGLVFFVYGMSRIKVDRADDYAHYSDIHEEGQDLQKVIVDTNNDEDDWKSYSKRVDGLEPGEKYYYRICVQYTYAQSDEITCGNTEYFKTKTGVVDTGGDTGSVVLETLPPETVGSTVAKVCGDLKDDGGNSSLLTWIEYRKASSAFYKKTTAKDRGEGKFCEVLRNLDPGTRYVYRACSEEGCASERYFTTVVTVPEGEAPQVTTGVAYDITAHSAKLPAIYVSNADRAVIYFKYGRSEYLNKRTRSYTVYGSHGEVVHNFTNLKSDQRYCYQAVIETRYGKDEGAVRCFYTLKASAGGTRPVRPTRPVQVVTVVEDDKPDIDLERLGLGLSLIQLDIDDQLDTVSEGQQITYTIRWKNISKLNLRDLELNVEIPREVQILGSSRGIIDRDRNSIFYTIDRLDPGEEGSMTVTGLVVDGNVGDALTANATIAFANPVNGAQENATDYDVDTFVLPVAGVNLGAGSIFGLGNVTLLGWLTILLGLLIIFLIARWLYLEREDLRAHAYANRMYGGYYPPEPAPRYREPARPSIHDVPSQRDVEARNDDDPGYRPYRPRH